MTSVENLWHARAAAEGLRHKVHAAEAAAKANFNHSVTFPSTQSRRSYALRSSPPQRREISHFSPQPKPSTGATENEGTTEGEDTTEVPIDSKEPVPIGNLCFCGQKITNPQLGVCQRHCCLSCRGTVVDDHADICTACYIEASTSSCAPLRAASAHSLAACAAEEERLLQQRAHTALISGFDGDISVGIPRLPNPSNCVPCEAGTPAGAHTEQHATEFGGPGTSVYSMALTAQPSTSFLQNVAPLTSPSFLSSPPRYLPPSAPISPYYGAAGLQALANRAANPSALHRTDPTGYRDITTGGGVTAFGPRSRLECIRDAEKPLVATTQRAAVASLDDTHYGSDAEVLYPPGWQGPTQSPSFRNLQEQWTSLHPLGSASVRQRRYVPPAPLPTPRSSRSRSSSNERNYYSPNHTLRRAASPRGAPSPRGVLTGSSGKMAHPMEPMVEPSSTSQRDSSSPLRRLPDGLLSRARPPRRSNAFVECAAEGCTAPAVSISEFCIHHSCFRCGRPRGIDGNGKRLERFITKSALHPDHPLQNLVELSTSPERWRAHTHLTEEESAEVCRDVRDAMRAAAEGQSTASPVRRTERGRSSSPARGQRRVTERGDIVPGFSSKSGRGTFTEWLRGPKEQHNSSSAAAVFISRATPHDVVPNAPDRWGLSVTMTDIASPVRGPLVGLCHVCMATTPTTGRSVVQ